MNEPSSALWHELKHHFPFSVAATAGGILLAGLMLYMAMIVAGVASTHETALQEHETAAIHEHEAAEAHDAVTTGAAEPGHGHEGHAHAMDPIAAEGGAIMSRASYSVFHIFHPIHLLFSAIATTAMFWRYERRLFKAIIVGIIGSLGVCGLSDVFIPYLGAVILGVHGVQFHWCLTAHPMLVVPFTVVGVMIGLFAAETVERCTYYSHSAHVFVSSAASLFYLISFGMTDWASRLGPVFVLLLVAVTLPCCFSDIAFPLLMIRRESRIKPACPIDHHHEHIEEVAGHGHSH
jgi:hypothetical protein